jgi:parvulin-like peptidyl-prolyl isomerase
MMKTLRENTKPIFMITIAAFVLLIFLDFGSSQLGGRNRPPADAIATVNGQAISHAEYEQNFEAAARSYGPRLLPYQEIELQSRVFNGLIDETLLRQAAERLGFRPSDRELLDMIDGGPPPEFFSSPEFQTDGRFDYTKYTRALEYRPFHDFCEAYWRERLPVLKLQNEIAAQGYVSDDEARLFLNARQQKATISYLRFSPADHGPDPDAMGEAELRAHLESHRKEYVPEKVAVVTYATILRQPSQTDTLETQELMQSMSYELEAGEDFGVLLNAHSEASGAMRGGRTGRFVPLDGSVLSFEMQDVVAKLAVGEHSQPFRDPFGFHIVKLDSTKVDERGQTLYRVADILVPVRASGATRGELSGRMVKFWSLVQDGSSFEAAADSTGAVLRTTDPIDLTPERVFVPDMPMFKELREWMESASPGDVTPVYESTIGYHVWRLDRRGPGEDPDFAAIQSRLRLDLSREHGRDLARRRADEAWARLRAGATLESVAAGDSLARFDSTAPFARQAVIPTIGRVPEIVGAAFAMEIGEIAGPFATEDGTTYIIRLEARDAPVADAAEAAVSLKRSLLQVKREAIVTDFMADLRAKAKIRDWRPVRTGTM